MSHNRLYPTRMVVDSHHAGRVVVTMNGPMRPVYVVNTHPDIVTWMTDSWAIQHDKPPKQRGQPRKWDTGRLMELLAAGKQQKEAAKELGINPWTVGRYLKEQREKAAEDDS